MTSAEYHRPLIMPHPMLRLFDGEDSTSPELRPDVQDLQHALHNFGFAVATDGIFGSETEAAVRQFQLDHDLYDDGIVGPATWAALLNQPQPDEVSTYPTTISRSSAEMQAQFAEAQKYKADITAAAQANAIDPIVLCGIGSRESGWGLLLKPRGPAGTGDFTARKFPTAFRQGALPPDGGFGRGLMQIDFDAYDFARNGAWRDPVANIDFGCKVLAQNLALISRKTSLKDRDALQAAIAAYNCGAGNVLRAIHDGRDLDFYTAGRNYSADTINRAGWFQLAGWD